MDAPDFYATILLVSDCGVETTVHGGNVVIVRVIVIDQRRISR